MSGNTDKVSTFISYAHADEDLKIELDKHLKVLKRSGKIEAWNDTISATKCKSGG
jgi:hypothetical protein